MDIEIAKRLVSKSARRDRRDRRQMRVREIALMAAVESSEPMEAEKIIEKAVELEVYLIGCDVQEMTGAGELTSLRTFPDLETK